MEKLRLGLSAIAPFASRCNGARPPGRWRAARGVCWLLAAIWLAAQPVHALVIDFDSDTTGLGVGDDFSVDIVVSGLSAAGEIVRAFDLFVGYDPSMLRLDSVSLGPGPDAGFVGDALFALGSSYDLGLAFLGVGGFASSELNLSGLSLVPGMLPFTQGDAVTLGTLNYTTLGAGNTLLEFLEHPFLGIPVDVKGVDPATPLEFDRIGKLAIATAVPEPGMLVLLTIGLPGLAWAFRRRKRAAN